MRNRWKFAFLTIMTVILVAIGVLLFQLFRPIDSSGQEGLQGVSPESEAEFTVTASRDDLTAVTNRFIEEEGLNGPINYSIEFKDQVILNGMIPIFTTAIDFQMTFEAQALENGNLLLKQEKLSLGAVDLPVSYVLKFIRDSYEFPEWVTIQPNEQQILVEVTEIEVAAGLNVKANRFNLPEDDISFSIYVPK
ncbi:YpmS family protein [Jeotgalibacillus soli]|uniref:DUF2140 family protein n=1 Tax=Jeotgalibacillus soli TaxID=889306 RepID=A0A0C2VHZ6_9BACL|nr:YpmS family protein [Jeotgalibacillus soli]KIL44126.1 hypothetical protein KP78_30900 [Jeotgalibacillus soli]